MTEPAFIPTDRLIFDLDELIGLPGSVGQEDQLAAVAARVAAMMRGRGLTVDVVATGGAPVVIGRRAGRVPTTLLLYHHYDVAPPGPWRAWHHEPFQMAERDGTLYGRGVAEGKGPLAAHLNAIAALIEAEGDLPCGVVVVAEGERLSGSPHLGRVAVERRALLKADACLATAGDRDAQGRPFAYSGVKGLLRMRLRASGPRQALPDGLAVSVPNPLWRLVWALGQIKSDQEEILIGGFYDAIEGPTRAENQALRRAVVDEAGRTAAWGISQFLFGMSHAALVQAEVTLPTCNVTSLAAEPASDLMAIPTSASARLDFQLVPRQLPQQIAALLDEHLAAKGMADVVAERLPGGYPAASTPFDHPFLQLVSDVGRHVYGAPLTLLPRGPFALPLFFFAESFGMPVATVGCGRPDSGANGPNEHILLPDLVRHGQLLIELVYACAQGNWPGDGL
ncbi:MAG TPA: M20/M25/M40 family metallo-hydrolase [Roseiflexaceae bacterium]|nr:M20/M25/M40 family metallo-hydrolase [Roseiflexaceae bacterium]